MRTVQRLLFSLLLTALGACGRDAPNFGGSVGSDSTSTRLRFEPGSFQLYRDQAFSFDVLRDGASVIGELSAFSVSPAGVVEIRAPGSGLAVGIGGAELLAEHDGEQARATVTVLDADLLQIIVQPSPITVVSGEGVQLKVSGFLSDGSEIDLTPTALGTTYESPLLRVDARGFATGLEPGRDVLVVRHADVVEHVEVIVNPRGNPLTKLEIIPQFLTLVTDARQQLQVIGTLENGTQIDLTRGELGSTYRTSSNAVASVTGNGQVRARGPGFAEITVENSGLSAICVVEVPGIAEIVRVQIFPRDLTIDVGGRATFQVRGLLADGSSIDLTGAPELTVSIQDRQVARVEGSNTVVGRQAGQTSLEATFRGLRDRIPVLVVDEGELVDLQIEPNPIFVGAGDFAPYNVYAFYANGFVEDVTFDPATAQFTDDFSIARIAGQGQLAGIGRGTTTLFASYRNFQAAARVIVDEVPNPYVSISIIVPAVMSVGDSMSMFVIGVRADGSFDDITFDPFLNLQSNRPNVVSVQPGSVQALSPGTAVITANYLGLVATAPVRVIAGPDPIVSLDWSPPSLSLFSGQSAPVQLIARFASGATANVSLDPTLQGNVNGPITVSPGNNEIIVTGLGAGVGRLEATYQGLTAVLEVFVDVQVLRLVLNFPSTIAVSASAPYTVQAELSDGRVIDVTFDPGLQLSLNPAGLLTAAGGRLTGVSPGVVVVEARYQGAVGSVRIRVTPANAAIVRIEFRPSSVSLSAGQTTVVDLVAVRSDGSEQSIAGDPALALLPGPSAGVSAGANGILVSLQGNVMQTFVDAFFQGFQARLVITSGPAPVLVGIRAEPNPLVLNVGDTAIINVIGLYSDGSERSPNTRLRFQSSNPQVASVSPNGEVTGQRSGSTEVRVVTDPFGFVDVVQVTVTDAPIVGLRVDPSALTMRVGDSITLTVYGVLADGSEILLTSGVTFQSFDPSIASVNAQGTISALRVGFAFITLLGPNGLNQTVLVSVVSGNIPQLISVTPNAIAVGSPSTTIIVTGQGFAPGDELFVGLTPVSTTILDANQLRAVIPSNLLSSEGTLEIRLVRITSGAFSNALTILVGRPPVVLGYVPDQVVLGGNIRVRITGTGLTQLSYTSPTLRMSGATEGPGGTSAEVTLTAPPNIPIGPAEVTLTNPFGSVVLIIEVLPTASMDLTVASGQVVSLSGTNTFGNLTVQTGGRIVAQGVEPLVLIATGNIFVRGRIEANGLDGAPGFQDAARGGDAGPGGGGGGAGGDGNSQLGAPGGLGSPNGQASGRGQGSGTPGGNGGGNGSGRGAAFQCGAGGGGGALGGNGGAGGGDQGPGTGGGGGSANGAGSDQGGGTGGGGGTTCGNNSGAGGGGGGGVLILQVVGSGTVLIDGVVEARGGRGGNGFQGTGGGGGGSGGLVVLAAESGSVIVNDTVRVSGGGGGDSDFGDTGGGGGGGIVVLASPTIVTSGGVLDVVGGGAGSSLGAGNAGVPGGAGQILVNP